MIKNQTLYIRVIFKTYLKVIKKVQIYFKKTY